ncbi:hypothetical protein T4A_12358 [Trichinella pseudospiralis]|uniref:Uncharacterized protein n=1 Tax=Trichinella pseudospiralis TaxID=6337 RepID=A0A0V1DUB6_TRIPS|nr:hypothetical protein T4A_12358 [Trichinella pseudospiralis]
MFFRWRTPFSLSLECKNPHAIFEIMLNVVCREKGSFNAMREVAMIVVEWLNEKSVGLLIVSALLVSDRALCQFTRLSKAWKVWKEWATFMRCRAYAVPCSIIIFHFCAECRKLSSGFAWQLNAMRPFG